MACDSCSKKQKFTSTSAKKGPQPSNSSSKPVGPKKTNTLLSKGRFSPYSANCTSCKAQLPNGGKFCQACAYKKGLCEICGKQVLDVKFYKQSNK
ncbi:hypothetical protein AKO1_013355 [Acrasis kona]|uniref:Cysteine-rich PDZ-binding protein n=1 Tax=Acrasis kona TaxID=1008807 RepID=A0AAW2Z0N9_9EUKA